MHIQKVFDKERKMLKCEAKIEIYKQENNVNNKTFFFKVKKPGNQNRFKLLVYQAANRCKVHI